MLFALAARNGVEVPYASVEALRAAYQFRELQDFLNLYYAGLAAVVEEQDFYDLASAYLVRARRATACAMPKSSSIRRRTPCAASPSRPCSKASTGPQQRQRRVMA